MRMNLVKLSIVMVSLVLMAPTCNKDTEDFEESCDLSARPLINRSIIVTVEVKYSDNVPYEGSVDLSLFKEYCDGRISGSFNKTGNTNAQGAWLPGMQYIYKFENDHDKVSITVKVSNSETSEEVIKNEVLTYADIEGLQYEVYRFFEITLPWPSK